MMVYSAHEVTAPNMKSSPAPMPAEAMLAMSPREITIHTPNSAMATPSQRRALRCSLSTSAEMVMVITGLSAMMSAARLRRQPLERGHEEQVVGEHAEKPRARTSPTTAVRDSFGKPPSSAKAATSSATHAITYRVNEPIMGDSTATTCLPATKVPPQMAGTAMSRA